MAKVVVAYASKRGSTAEIAQAIAAVLRESGHAVDCDEAGTVAELDGYDAVVLGSAVYMKRWRREATRFLRKHGKDLSRRPFWVFSSGPVGDPATDDPAWTEPRGIVRRTVRLGTRGHVVFGGRISTTSRRPLDRAMVKSIPPEFRDRRDWDRIREWAEGIASGLGVAVPAPSTTAPAVMPMATGADALPQS